jgi:hypothetical protein
MDIDGATPWEAVRRGSFGSNPEILRSALSFKISGFVDFNIAYSVEVSICGCQVDEPLFTHKGHNKGIIRQQPLALPNLAACLHNAKCKWENSEAHVGDSPYVILILSKLFAHLWGFPKLSDGRPGGDEPRRDGFGYHAPGQHFCKNRRGGIPEQCATGTALQQGFTFQ